MTVPFIIINMALHIARPVIYGREHYSVALALLVASHASIDAFLC